MNEQWKKKAIENQNAAREIIRSAEEKMAGFSDVDAQEWYYDGVFWVIEKGIMNGTGDHAFEPLTSARLRRKSENPG